MLTRIETISKKISSILKSDFKHIVEEPSSEFVEKYKYEIGDIAFSQHQTVMTM
jgi:hypothetical protein